MCNYQKKKNNTLIILKMENKQEQLKLVVNSKVNIMKKKRCIKNKFGQFILNLEKKIGQNIN